MDEIKLNLNEKGHGAFIVMNDEEQVGEMVISVNGKDLTVYHTEVSPKVEGKGFAKKLLNGMADYAEKNNLSVIPLCSYVLAQFMRHPKDYAGIWQKEEEDNGID